MNYSGLVATIPEILKGDARGTRKSAKGARKGVGDELVVLAGKVADGTATKKEMTRFKKLAEGA